MKRLTLLTWFAAAALPPSLASAQLVHVLCPGDCDGDRTVTVDELVMGANIALGDERLECSGGFGPYAHVDVTHLTQAISRALYGCTAVGNVQFSVGDRRSAGHTADDAINLIVFTEEVFPCLGYTIAASVNLEERSISLSLTGIRRPGAFCLTAIGPAVFSMPIALSPGEYALSIRSGAPTDRYKVTVTDESIDTDVIHASFSGPAHYTTPRRNFFVASCYRMQYFYQKAAERAFDELCPVFFAQLDRVAEWTKPLVSNSWCADFRLQRGECRVYHYTGVVSTLESLLEASQHYDLPRGYTTGRGHSLYSWDLETSGVSPGT